MVLKDDSPRQFQAKPNKLELPTPSTARGPRSPNPSHLLPATALFHGPHSRNASHTSLSRSRDDRPNDPSTPIDRNRDRDQPQHLPRARPPTSSFSGPRPSLIAASPKNNAPGGGQTGASAVRPKPGATISSKKEDDFRADAVWAEMQRTLADVELSAMNSSHVFGQQHARALEDLRTAQLGLAQAWAKSEADEMVDEEFGGDEGETSAVGTMRGGIFGGTPAREKSGHSRHASTASNASRSGNLEEETERDIRLARRRREANDRYFKQVNKGVLDVVKKLDEVANAMRQVEKESRELWNETSGSGSEDLGDVTETDQSTQQQTKNKDIERPGGRSRAETAESQIFSLRTETTDALSDSPESKR
ncbi:hypothetical protein LTR64_005265 [Lithohypha guttulata]|uniref:uncharacterized protein n=1 Tax=Lithohypha guttulata TaxID=1690604 RepID=UPI002DDF8676|nr:hypothetical protein LTR51_002943 [Lithohypha guttulata]